MVVYYINQFQLVSVILGLSSNNRSIPAGIGTVFYTVSN